MRKTVLLLAALVIGQMAFGQQRYGYSRYPGPLVLQNGQMYKGTPGNYAVYDPLFYGFGPRYTYQNGIYTPGMTFGTYYNSYGRPNTVIIGSDGRYYYWFR